MGYSSLVNKRTLTKNHRSVNLDREIDSVILSLEEIAEALENYCYDEEAQVVLNHLNQLKNPAVRGKVRNFYSNKKISPDTCVNMLMEKMAEAFENPRRKKNEPEWYLPECI